MGVITVTFNPAIDQTVTLDRLVPGEVHRPRSVRQDVGGKGVNVASCLADWGVPVAAFGLLGADNAVPFETLFRIKGVEDRFRRVPGATRINFKIVDDENTTDINFDGPPATSERIEAVAAEVEALAGAGTLVVLAGSLPPGCPADTYAGIVARLTAKGARVFLDTSGPPLAKALEGAVLPHCIKPNRHELADWAGTPLADIGDVVRAAAGLHARGVSLVVVSMGPQGALFLSDEGALIARRTVDNLASTVGAGDAMVAGIVAATIEGADLARTARLATAFAVGKLGKVGPNLPDPETVRALAETVDLVSADIADAAHGERRK
ncbi:1-phosphofructokinase [Pseudochelatococcus sp. B33]